MSILDKIRGVKRAASQHKAKGSKSDDAKPVVEPYKHIPTHAAIDALSGAPSSWKAEDRTAIIAQHKRRSAMSRQNSGLSTVTTINRGNSFNTTEWTTTTTDQRRHRPAYQSMIVPEERHERRHPISRGTARTLLILSVVIQLTPRAEISPVDSSDNSTSTTSSRDSSCMYSMLTFQVNVFQLTAPQT